MVDKKSNRMYNESIKSKEASAMTNATTWELKKFGRNWYILKNGLSFASFSTKKAALKALDGYKNGGWA